MGKSDDYTTLFKLHEDLKEGETICAIKNNNLILGYKKGFVEFKTTNKNLIALESLLDTWEKTSILITEIEFDGVTINDTGNPYMFELKINDQLQIVTIPELKSILKILKNE